MLSKHINFKGMTNLRDLGGMTNVFEKKIKSNLLFRSDHLHNATQADMEKLKKLGVRYILDLRNLEERTEQPDQKIEGITYIPMSLSPERNAGIAKDKKSREELQKDAIKKASADPKFFFYEMSGYYADYATVPYTFEQMHNFFQTLLQTNGGVLWHCAGGKDRTGILTVLLCEVLQIPKKDIEADYLATNLYKQKEADAEIINIQKILPPDCPIGEFDRMKVNYEPFPGRGTTKPRQRQTSGRTHAARSLVRICRAAAHSGRRKTPPPHAGRRPYRLHDFLWTSWHWKNDAC